MKRSTRVLRAIGLWLVHRFGSQIIDARTQQPLGRALVIAWRGKIHVIGLNAAVTATWVPQKRLTYWKQEIAFSSHPRPDFPHQRADADDLPPET